MGSEKHLGSYIWIFSKKVKVFLMYFFTSIEFFLLKQITVKLYVMIHLLEHSLVSETFFQIEEYNILMKA